MAAKSENGDISVRVIDYTAHPPPPPPPPGSSEKPGVTLTQAQVAMHEKVLEHFQSESYKIPGIKDGELLEVEKFWLVRVFVYYYYWESIFNYWGDPICF
jgi:hypothetical protein